MDRRTLLTALLGGGTMGSALVVRDAEPQAVLEYPTYAHPLYTDGLRLHWSGWKGSQQNWWLVGQWFAWPEPGRMLDGKFYYVSVPGMVGNRYAPGDCFNITPQGRYVYPETSDEEKDHLIWLGCEHLRELIRVARG